jgi:hypothetical protein
MFTQKQIRTFLMLSVVLIAVGFICLQVALTRHDTTMSAVYAGIVLVMFFLVYAAARIEPRKMYPKPDSEDSEYIIAAAIRIRNDVHWLPAPAYYRDIFHHMQKVEGLTAAEISYRGESGFMTNRKRFVTSKVARGIAFINGQIAHMHGPDRGLSTAFSADELDATELW